MLEPCASTPDAPAGDTALSPDDLNRIARLLDARGGRSPPRRPAIAPPGWSLDAYEHAVRSNPRPQRERRHRLEHAAFIADADLPRLRPAQRNRVAPAVAGRADPGPHRRAGAQRGQRTVRPRVAVREHRRRGEPAGVRNRLAGRAAEPDGRDPRRRQPDHRGRLPEGGWNPAERLPLKRAIDAFTSGPAYASFDEQRKGSLKVGMLADLVVLSTDIFDAPPSRLASTTVAVTIFDGKIVYRRNAARPTRTRRPSTASSPLPNSPGLTLTTVPKHQHPQLPKCLG